MSSVVHHTLQPWYTAGSRVLILGTIPSVKSRESGCYYGHPQNRFWPTLAAVFREETPVTVEDRRLFCKRHCIALWDVLASCNIEGSSDTSIRDPIPNDIAALLRKTTIDAIFTTGKKAAELYEKIVLPQTGVSAISLPSTSPANRRWYSTSELIEAYAVIQKYI